jgi:hypothetical protein
MRRFTSAFAAAVLVGTSAAAAPAAPTIDDALALLRSETAIFGPYRKWGIDPGSGYTFDMRPTQNAIGDCQTQRLDFLFRFAPVDPRANGVVQLREMRLTHRYWRPGWTPSTAPRDCGSPDDPHWTEAANATVFNYAANALAILATRPRGEASSSPAPRTAAASPAATPRRG